MTWSLFLSLTTYHPLSHPKIFFTANQALANLGNYTQDFKSTHLAKSNLQGVTNSANFSFDKVKVKKSKSNYCFDSLAIKLWSKDFKQKHLIPGNGPPGLQG